MTSERCLERVVLRSVWCLENQGMHKLVELDFCVPVRQNGVIL